MPAMLSTKPACHSNESPAQSHRAFPVQPPPHFSDSPSGSHAQPRLCKRPLPAARCRPVYEASGALELHPMGPIAPFASPLVTSAPHSRPQTQPNAQQPAAAVVALAFVRMGRIDDARPKVARAIPAQRTKHATLTAKSNHYYRWKLLKTSGRNFCRKLRWETFGTFVARPHRHDRKGRTLTA